MWSKLLFPVPISWLNLAQVPDQVSEVEIFGGYGYGSEIKFLAQSGSSLHCRCWCLLDINALRLRA